MTRCPKCHVEHRGSRDLTALRSEAAHVLVRADAMPMDEARAYLRTQWLGGALELADWCSSCIVSEIAIHLVQVVHVRETEQAMEVVHVRETEQAMEAVTDPRHVCTILPFRRPATREAVARDLLDIGSIHDTERKP